MSAELKIANMADFFTKEIHLLADAKMSADADLPFLTQLELIVQKKWRQPMENAMNGQPQGGPMGGPVGLNGPPMAPPGASPQQLPPGIGGGGPGIGQGLAPQPGFGQAPPSRGVMTGPSMPASDELRRMLAHAGGPHH